MTNVYQLLTTAAAATGESGDIWGSLLSYAPIVIVIIAFYFVLIRPQQKKDKEDKAMRENLDIGDEIVTAGGIIGRIVSQKCCLSKPYRCGGRKSSKSRKEHQGLI